VASLAKGKKKEAAAAAVDPRLQRGGEVDAKNAEKVTIVCFL
jgi:hypothetical protein